MNICGYYPESINEGDGLRAVIYISGCKHRCKGCFNPHTWNFTHGEDFTPEMQKQIVEDIQGNPLLQGVTLCGGDPFFSSNECVPFILKLRKALPNMDLWAYTGFTYEELLEDEDKKSLLLLCDVIIDGRFMEHLKDTTLQYRGSLNQRIINVKKSIGSKDIVLWNKKEMSQE